MPKKTQRLEVVRGGALHLAVSSPYFQPSLCGTALAGHREGQGARGKDRRGGDGAGGGPEELPAARRVRERHQRGGRWDRLHRCDDTHGELPADCCVVGFEARLWARGCGQCLRGFPVLSRELLAQGSLGMAERCDRSGGCELRGRGGGERGRGGRRKPRKAAVFEHTHILYSPLLLVKCGVAGDTWAHSSSSAGGAGYEGLCGLRGQGEQGERSVA